MRQEPIYTELPLTNGELVISTSTSFPVDANSRDFVITSPPYESPRFLTIKAFILGTSASTSTVTFYVCFYDDVSSRWYRSSPLICSGTSVNTGGQVWRIMCPEGSLYGNIYVPSLPSGLSLAVVVRKGM